MRNSEKLLHPTLVSLKSQLTSIKISLDFMEFRFPTMRNSKLLLRKRMKEKKLKFFKAVLREKLSTKSMS